MGSSLLSLEEIIEWDIKTWSQALKIWEDGIHHYNLSMDYGLEIGANRGGLSLFFADKYNSKIICSDYMYPEKAVSHHSKFPTLKNRISYKQVDGTKILFPDNEFDFVTLKSVLGGIGANNEFKRIEQSISEIYRVLKPRGAFLFSENLTGTILHQWARKTFIPWGNRWRYISIDELKSLLCEFDKVQLQNVGFLAAFFPGSKNFKNLAASADNQLKFIPETWKYVSIGIAIK